MYDWLRLIHLLSAAVWTGGLIVLAASVVALRRAGADRVVLVAVARMFARVSWTAIALASATGIWQLLRIGAAASNPTTEFGRALFVKLLLVGAAAGLALWHQLGSTEHSAKVRGITQAAILVTSIGIFAAAVWLGSASFA